MACGFHSHRVSRLATRRHRVLARRVEARVSCACRVVVFDVADPANPIKPSTPSADARYVISADIQDALRAWPLPDRIARVATHAHARCVSAIFCRCHTRCSPPLRGRRSVMVLTSFTWANWTPAHGAASAPAGRRSRRALTPAAATRGWRGRAVRRCGRMHLRYRPLRHRVAHCGDRGSHGFW